MVALLECEADSFVIVDGDVQPDCPGLNPRSTASLASFISLCLILFARKMEIMSLWQLQELNDLYLLKCLKNAWHVSIQYVGHYDDDGDDWGGEWGVFGDPCCSVIREHAHM